MINIYKKIYIFKFIKLNIINLTQYNNYYYNNY